MDQPPHQLTIRTDNDDRVYCRLDINHALMDAVSSGILLRDFTLALTKRLDKRPGPLYRDYISYIQTAPKAPALEYWQNYLSGMEPCHFPTTFGDARNPNRLQNVAINIALANGLEATCKSLSVTLSNVIQVAWALVLRQYTDSDNVCFGYITSGRDVPLERLDETIGLYVNMLVYRCEVQKCLALADLLRDAKYQYTTSLPYQHFSLAELFSSMDLSGKGLFNTAMSVHRISSTKGLDYVSSAFELLDAEDPTEVSKP